MAKVSRENLKAITSTQLNYEHRKSQVIIWFLEETFKSQNKK